MSQPITAPPARRPAYSLVGVAPSADQFLTARALADGWEMAPEACGPGGQRSTIDCGSVEAGTPGTNPAWTEGTPFVVRAFDECSAMSFQLRDYAARARRQLESVESYQIAAELWGGSLGLGQRSLTDLASDRLTSAAATPVAAVACLEAGLATCGGAQGMVHVPAQLLPYLAAEGVVRRDGNVWVTPMGHLVVADAGYDGTGPGGLAVSSTQYAYATSMIYVGMGEVMVTPDTIAEAMDRSVNLVTFEASRLASWVWDECCHFAAEVNVPVCAFGGGS